MKRGVLLFTRKKCIIILNLILIIVNINCSKSNGSCLAFTTYDHYFVKNTFHVDSTGCFLEIHDTASFDSVFSAAATMEKNTWIVSSDFRDNCVISVIKDFGNNNYDLKIKKVCLYGSSIRIDYDYKLIEKNLSYSSTGNAIAMIKNQSHKMIKFYENGIFIKQISILNH